MGTEASRQEDALQDVANEDPWLVFAPAGSGHSGESTENWVIYKVVDTGGKEDDTYCSSADAGDISSVKEEEGVGYIEGEVFTKAAVTIRQFGLHCDLRHNEVILGGIAHDSFLGKIAKEEGLGRQES